MRHHGATIGIPSASAAILVFFLCTDQAAAKTLNVYPINAAGASITTGTTVCLGTSATTVNQGPQTTGSGGGTTFTNVSETQPVYVNVIAQGIGTAQRVMDPGTNDQVFVTVPGQFAVPAAVQSVCVASSGGGTTTTTLPPAPGVQPSPGIVFDRQRAAELILKANYFQQGLYPVYSHPRCVNCHGRVDPPSGRNHPQTSAACSTCHSVQGWTNAGAPSFWSGSGTTAKSWQDICNAVRNHPKSANRNVFLDHMQNDRLIGWALAPTPIAGNPARPAAPGGRNAFIANSLRWFDEGMQCGLQPYQGPFPFRR